ncbi:unnamed protein product, partial [Effrenium voratum]
LDELLLNNIVDRVPEKLKFFACALERAPDYWADEPRIRKDMELEAYSDDHIATVLGWIRAQRRLVERYLQGELDPREELEVEGESKGAASRQALDPCQQRLKALVDRSVQRSMEARDAEDDESYEAALRTAENSKILGGRPRLRRR